MTSATKIDDNQTSDWDETDLGLMWQSAPARRRAAPAQSEVVERALPEAPVPDPVTDEGTGTLEQLEARICSLAGRLATACAEWLLLVAEFDRRKGWVQWGVRSCAHWLAWSCSVSPMLAREYVRVARCLETLPLLTEAFAAGRLSFSKMRAVTRVAARIPEQTLLEQALVHTSAQLERVVRGYRRAAGSGAHQQVRRRAEWFWDVEGMLVVRARLSPDEGALVIAALEAAAHSLDAPPGEVIIPPGVPLPSRPPGAELIDADPDRVSAADTLVALAQQALAAGPVDSSGDDRQLLVVHADRSVLQGGAGGTAVAEQSISDDPMLLCRLENGPGLDSVTAERIACDAAVVAALWSSHGPAGEALSLGRRTRKISVPLRRALRLRDGGCRFPGCHRLRHLQAHHVVHWLRGGPTDLPNLVLLCRFHHALVHESGFRVQPADGGWAFHRPDGIPIPASPPLEPLLAQEATAGPPGWDPGTGSDSIRPGWRGEAFSLADSVGVWCRADERLAEHQMRETVA